MFSPADFIPILEEAGEIYKLDLYIVDQVLEKMKAHKAAGLNVVPQSVNLSRSDFDACDIVEEIRRRVDDSGFGRDKITIEITESIIGSDAEFMTEQIRRFRELGFLVWMDDFGSGYSSLDVLQSIDFDLIKFDMRFMQQFNEGGKGRIILTELMQMATSLGVDTVCEGVETAEQVQFLREIGCSKLQGYYFEKPMPYDQILVKYAERIRTAYENPEETPYYDAIGRVNLYDLSVVAREDENRFQNYFNTLPMAVLEIKGNLVRFTRSNQSYRDFMRKVFDINVADNTELTEMPPTVAGTVFMKQVKQCCQEESRAFIDEKMPDNTNVHSFIRRLSINPVTGTTAIATVVLSIEDANMGTTYANIARALASDYFNLFYVDMETEQFIEYSSDSAHGNLAIERHGVDFFNQSRKDARKVLYPEDQDAFIAVFTKENVVHALDDQGDFRWTYRQMINGEPVYVTMKAMRMQIDERYIIIGVGRAKPRQF